MERDWNKKITKYEILKKLLKYKKQGYNHVTYLWWEPFIQEVFLDALKLWKKLWYTILVTTNCTTLHIEKQAEKFLPYIDELFLSVEAIDIEKQQKISRTKNYVHWEKVFENIYKYWNWHLMKANIVITQDNKNNLLELVWYLKEKKVNDIAITYPDIDLRYYWKEHILEKVAPSYSEAVEKVLNIIDYCEKNKINLRLPDFPFCVFWWIYFEKYLKLTDDCDYWDRLKVSDIMLEDDKIFFKELKRSEVSPRSRIHFDKCSNCKYIKNCWGIARDYKQLYSLNEINPIT